MALLEIRLDLIEASGRADFTDGGTADALATRIINQGIQILDRLIQGPDSKKRWQKDIAAGDFFIHTDQILTIERIWRASADGRFRLEKFTLDEARACFSKPKAELTTGPPTGYARNIIHLAVGLVVGDITFDDEDIDDLAASGADENRGILIYPPADKAYTMTVLGRMKSKVLSAETDTNYWATEWPQLVVSAAMYRLERLMRNSTGANEHMQDIMFHRDLIEFEEILEETEELQQLEG